jgi:plastocyanin
MRSLIKTVTFLFLVVVSMVAVSCGPGNQASQQSPTSPSGASVSQMTVNIFTDQSGFFGFNPKTLPVPVGTTVTWKNTTQVAHTVTSDDGTSFDSGIVPAGGTFTFRFTKAGSYAYHCDIHPYMKAMVVVK